MRFTLRDLFWLIVVAACCCGWYITYRAAVKAEAERALAVESWVRSNSDDPFAPLKPEDYEPFAPPKK